MLTWVLILLMAAVIAAVFGFTSIAVTFTYIAKIIFYIFLALIILTIVVHLLR